MIEERIVRFDLSRTVGCISSSNLYSKLIIKMQTNIKQLPCQNDDAKCKDRNYMNPNVRRDVFGDFQAVRMINIRNTYMRNIWRGR